MVSSDDSEPPMKRQGKATGFTKDLKLSDELAAVVGTSKAPRHEVVKQLWAYIKENNLQDPTNKQFAVCDDKLMKVIGEKKFKCFGMAKYLKDHISLVHLILQPCLPDNFEFSSIFHFRN